MAASSSSFHNEVVAVMPHRFEGVFMAKGKEEDALCTKNLVPGEAFYDEELISVQNEDGTDVEYRVWNPVRSKLASAILSGVGNIWTGDYIDPNSQGEAMFTSLGRYRKREFKPLELVPLKPLERDLTYIVGGVFRMPE